MNRPLIYGLVAKGWNWDGFNLADKAPFASGINRVQLFYDEARWWIVRVYWMGETEERPIPERYLPD